MQKTKFAVPLLYFHFLVTSELDMSDHDMRKVYCGLAKIEDSFKVTKTCFESRPVYVWLNEHINAHFTTCFLALVLIRLLEQKLRNRFSAAQILRSLGKYNCTHLDANNWQFTYYDKVLDACADAFDMKLNDKYKTQQQIQRMLRY